MIPIPSGPMPFSSRGRGWRALAALLLFYAGCLYNHRAWGKAEPPIWYCEGHPSENRILWLTGEKVTALGAGSFEIEPGGYRVRVLGELPEGSAVGARLHARIRYRKAEGFTLEPGARASPPLPVNNLDLFLVSVPALAFVALAFLRRFRPTLALEVEPRA